MNARSRQSPGRPVNVFAAVVLSFGCSVLDEQRTFAGTPASVELIYTQENPNNIHRLFLETSTSEILQAGDYPFYGIVADTLRGQVYWSSVFDRRIYRADLEGGSSAAITTTTSLAGYLALDELGGHLYWNENQNASTFIRRMSLGGGSQVTMLQQSGSFDVTAMELDRAARKLYWAEASATTHRIRRASLDDFQPEMVIENLAPEVYDIAVDSVHGNLYWTQSGSGAIQRANLDGTDAQSFVGAPGAVFITVDSSSGDVFWTEYFLNRVRKASIDGSVIQDVVTDTGWVSGLIAITASDYIKDCNFNGIDDRCELDCSAMAGDCNVPGCGTQVDCNGNDRLDSCDIAYFGGADCNHNEALDSCDIQFGLAVDDNGDDIPDECCAPPCSLTAEPHAVMKNRFLSFAAPPGIPAPYAIRVRLTSLYDVDTAGAPDFSAFEGEYRYLNTLRDPWNGPDFDCWDRFPHSPYRCAQLGCVPEYRDWNADVNGEIIHATGSAVVPDSTYEVSLLPQFCQGFEASCSTQAIGLATAAWGDLDPGVINVVDVGRAIDHLKGTLDSYPEHRVLLRTVDPRITNTSIVDVSLIVDSIKGFAYPFSIESCP